MDDVLDARHELHTPDDVRAVVHPVLRHRLILTYEAEAENITSVNIVEKILNTLPVP